jgi:hypothetical protein
MFTEWLMGQRVRNRSTFFAAETTPLIALTSTINEKTIPSATPLPQGGLRGRAALLFPYRATCYSAAVQLNH